MKQLIRYLIWFLLLFAGYNSQAQNNTVYGAGISYTNGVPSWTPNPRTSRAAVDTVTGRWYHFNTPGGWQWIGNTVEEIAGCAAPAYTPNKGDSRLVINNCVKPEVYWYDGAAWIWINQGEVYTAGQGIRIESNSIILDSLYVLRFRTGSNTDGAAGAMSWNATEETVDLVTDQGAVTGHLMESAYYNTRNTTGTPITIGTVVMANGTTGNTGRILIAPAIADGSVNSEYILGLAAQTIGNNSNGKVQHFGKIRGIQTNGANFGETWVDGDVLYCSASTPGYLTKVLPTAPNLKVPIAIVIHAHPSNGTLFVRPSHFPDLAQINDVQLSSPTNGQVLTYNSTLSRWENATPANQLQTLSTDGSAGNISISSGNTITLNVNDADASATNELQTLSTGTNTLTLSNGGGTVTVDTDPSTDVTGSGAAGQVSFWTGAQTQSGSNNLFWDNSNGRLGIGTNVPTTNLHVIGTILASTQYTLGTQNTMSISGSGNTERVIFRVGAGGSLYNNLTLFEVTSQANISSTFGTTRLFNVQRGFFPTSGSAAYDLISTNPTINQTGGANGITRGLHIEPTLTSAADWRSIQWDNNSGWGIYGAGTATNYLAGSTSIGSTSTPARLHVVGSGTSSSTWTAQFHNSAGNNNALMIRDDGNVGIGTSNPSVRLSVSGDILLGAGYLGVAGNTVNSYPAILNSCHIFQTGQTGAGYPFNGVGNLVISSRYGTSRDIILSTFVGTTAFERMVIKGDGKVGIGTTTPAEELDVVGDIQCTGVINSVGGVLNELKVSGTTIPKFTINNTTGSVVDAMEVGQLNFFINDGNTGGNTPTGNIAMIISDNLVGGTYQATAGEGSDMVFRTGIVDVTGQQQTINERLRITKRGNFEFTSTTGGILFPRMTTAQRDLIATPADGLVIYNTSTNKLQVRAGGAWVDLH